MPPALIGLCLTMKVLLILHQSLHITSFKGIGGQPPYISHNNGGDWSHFNCHYLHCHGHSNFISQISIHLHMFALVIYRFIIEFFLCPF